MRAIAAAALVVTAAGAARADDVRVEVIGIDAVSDAMMMPRVGRDAAHEDVEEVMLLGLLGHLVGAPTIHAAHGEWGTAGIDLGARAAAPVLGWFAGDAACERWQLDSPYHDYNHCFWLATTGGLAGALAAQIVDWAVLSRPDQPRTVMLSFGARF